MTWWDEQCAMGDEVLEPRFIAHGPFLIHLYGTPQ